MFNIFRGANNLDREVVIWSASLHTHLDEEVAVDSGDIDTVGLAISNWSCG